MSIALAQKFDALYCRYSSEKQDGGTSIEVQLEHTHRDADHNVIEYVDRAKSGRAMGKRASFKRLRDDIYAGRIKRLFVYKYDRLGRSKRLHQIVDEFEKHGCEVISCTEGRDKLVRGIQLVLADNYSEVLAERTRDGLCKRFEQGTHTGGEARYGYQIIKGEDGRSRRAIHPDEIEVAKQVVQMYRSEPVGLKKIAARLDQMGIPSRESGPWTHTSVRGVLTNRWFVGEVTYKERQFVMDEDTGCRLPKRRDKSQHMCRREESLRTMSDEEFEAVQSLLQSRSRPRGAAKAVNGVRPFTGHIFCESCGSVCYHRKSKNSKGEYRYYNCGCRQRQGPQACPNSGSVREDRLLNLINGICGDILADREGVIAESMKIGVKQMDRGKTETNRLQREIADLDAQSRSLMMLMMNPAIESGALTAFSRQIAEKESERGKIEYRMARLGASSSQGQDRLGTALAKAYQRASESFTKIASDTHVNRFVEEYIGPMLLTSDGRVKPKRLETTTASGEPEAVVNIAVAGARYARRPQNSPSVRQFSLLSARAVFWAHLRAVA